MEPFRWTECQVSTTLSVGGSHCPSSVHSRLIQENSNLQGVSAEIQHRRRVMHGIFCAIEVCSVSSFGGNRSSMDFWSTCIAHRSEWLSKSMERSTRILTLQNTTRSEQSGSSPWDVRSCAFRTMR